MNILPLSIRKILPAYFAIELMFAGLLVFSPFVFQVSTLTTIYQSGMATYVSMSKPLVGERASEPLAANEVKLVHFQYYGKQFDVETDAKTFGELAAILPFAVEAEHLDTLASVELFSNMEVKIPPNQYQIGTASWYGAYFHGRPTASTEPYNMYELTAAHKTLPLGTKVKITNIQNKKSVIVKINDRGPFVGERIIDLSWEAARQLGFVRDGLATVVLELVE